MSIVAYTTAVSWLMYNGEVFFGKADNFWMPVALLLLFVLSAAIVGLLMFGMPVYLYLESRKKGALKLLGLTVAEVFLFTVAALILNVFI